MSELRPLEGAPNFRDLGGLPTADGGWTRRGFLFRSSGLEELTEADVRHLVDDVGLRTVRDYPNDLRPSKVTHALGHIGGTTCELVMPLVLLFSPWPWMTWIAIVSIWMLHSFILSTIPIAVPLEWNVFFMFVVAFLFANFHAGSGYGIGDMDPVLLVVVVCVALAPIVLGALRPQYVSFLVGMKQYAGNQIDQIEPLFGREIAEIFIQKAVAFRMMRPMGRMHISALMRHVDSMDDRIQREGEFVSNVLTGWNFGDGHCLDERLIEGLQERCQYEPGDVVVAFTESQPAFSKKVQYRVIDAALGTVEKGWYHNDDAANEQPWLPNGSIPHTVTWTLPDYVAPGVAHPGTGGRV